MYKKDHINQEFYDKVYACWLGKNIGGTLGGPLEGRMELLDIKGYTQSFLEPMENDDLDLQLVSLHAVEQYAGWVNTHLLSQEWLSHVHFQYDEYGHALTNIRQGIRPPLSGCYNNYFTDCMGSPIRSELWGVLCAGMPDLAAYFAIQDAFVDHAGGEGVYGEVFFAVFESLAFFNTDIKELIVTALSYLPDQSETSSSIKLLLRCYEEGLPWKKTRQILIDRFGKDNFTYAPLNIAFTLIGLLYGTGFTERLLITTNCGYDTDCTCATLASMMGILYGSDYIDDQWKEPLGEKIIVSSPVNGFNAPKNIQELTIRTIKAHQLMISLRNIMPKSKTIDPKILLEQTIYRENIKLPCSSIFVADYECNIFYEDKTPYYIQNTKKKVTISIKNKLTVPITLNISVEFDGNKLEKNESKILKLQPNEKSSYQASFCMEEKCSKYSGYFIIERIENNSVWSETKVPFVLLPSQDWLISFNTTQTQGIKLAKEKIYSNDNVVSSHDDGNDSIFISDGAVHKMKTTNEWQSFCKTALVPLSDFDLSDCVSICAQTNLYVNETKKLKLIAVCAQPLDIIVDDKLVASSQDTTPEIPAYHRPVADKTAVLPLERGYHTVRILIKDGNLAENLYFYVVDPEFNYASYLNYFLQLPNY